jgi:hypothetical protein
MENEPERTNTDAQEEKKSDAAALSARIVALKGDSDDYSYAEPPTYTRTPKVSFQKKITRLLFYLVAAGILFAGGYAVGARRTTKLLNPPVAIVNGDVISNQEFSHACEIPVGRAVLQRMITDKLALKFASAVGVMPDQKAVEAKYTEESRTPDFFAKLKNANQSPDDYKHALLVLMCNQAVVSNGMKVNPSEVQDYYKHNIDKTNRSARYFHPESVQVQVIMSPNMESIENAQKDIANKLPFAGAAAKYSIGSTRMRGGILPVMIKGRTKIDGVKYPGLEKVLFDLQTGQTSDAIKVGTTYWLIRCIAHNPETTDTFEQVQDDCTTAVLVQKGIQKNGEELKAKETDFVKKANVDIQFPQYADIYAKR